MNVSDRLQLIKALEERERGVARRAGLVAWTSVGLAAVVLMVLIGGGSYELANVRGQVTSARTELDQKQKDLNAAEARLATVKTETDEALRKLQTVQDRRENPRVVEAAVDNLLAASAAATPQETVKPSATAARGDAIRRLFDATPAVRVRAYGELLPRYANDPTLVPEILAMARNDPGNANGVYNALVVLSHMNAAALRPHREAIITFAQEAEHLGPRVTERARTLVSRVGAPGAARQAP